MILKNDLFEHNPGQLTSHIEHLFAQKQNVFTELIC